MAFIDVVVNLCYRELVDRLLAFFAARFLPCARDTVITLVDCTHFEVVAPVVIVIVIVVTAKQIAENAFPIKDAVIIVIAVPIPVAIIIICQ